MKFTIFLVLLLNTSLTFAQDVKRCEQAEPAYLNRMPGFYISECKNSEYNNATFIYYVSGTAKKINKGGKYHELWYSKTAGEERKFSSAQILENYSNALMKVKGVALDDKKSMFAASLDGKEVYIQVFTAANSVDARSYRVVVLEVSDMKQDVAITLKEALDRDGKVPVYGIQFDVNKSIIKAESEKALEQIIDYLNSNPSEKIIVVGHTDNTGEMEANMSLSKARALAVKEYLTVKGKIDPTRLAHDGVGPLCPVSTNTSEEGKALNRRVEIVRQ